MASVMLRDGSVFATRSGMMKGTLEESLPSAAVICGKGRFSRIAKVRASTAS
jgi:hypothetical protein